MKTLKLIIPIVTLFCLINNQQLLGQEASKEVLNEIANQEQQIRINEETLLDGIEGLDRIKKRFEKEESVKKFSSQELERKRITINNIETRLSKVSKELKKQKKSLNKYKEKFNVTATEKVTETQNNSGGEETLADRQARLQVARAKLEKERNERETQYLKEQEELHIQAENLKKIDAQIKLDEEIINKKKEDAINLKIEANRDRIYEYEDDITVDNELLISGKESLKRAENSLKEVKENTNSTQKEIDRKQSIVEKIKIRLSKIETGIEEKKAALFKLKNPE